MNAAVRLKYLVEEVDERAGDRDLRMLSVSIHRGVVPREDISDRPTRADDCSSYKVVRPGDLALNRMRAFQGAVGLVEEVGMVSPDYTVLRSKDSSPAFLHHLFRSHWFVGEMVRRMRGIGSIDQGNVRTPRVNFEDLCEILVDAPALPEQKAVADFLDVETARLDDLIAALRQQAALVVERFQALAEYAIWSRATSMPLSRRTDPRRPIMYGIVLPGPDVRPGGVLLVKGGDIAQGRLTPDQLCRTTAEIEFPFARARLRGGDVLVAIRGGIGDVSIVPHAIEGANITQDVARVAPYGVDAKWLAIALRTHTVRAEIERRTTGATIRGLNIWELKKISVPDSDPARQQEDLNRLAGQSDLTRELRQTLERQQFLLQERKQALITAAVTGQLDLARNIAEEAS